MDQSGSNFYFLGISILYWLVKTDPNGTWKFFEKRDETPLITFPYISLNSSQTAHTRCLTTEALETARRPVHSLTYSKQQTTNIELTMQLGLKFTRSTLWVYV